MNEIVRQIPDWLMPAVIIFTSVIAGGIILDRLRLLMFRVKAIHPDQEEALFEFVNGGNLKEAMEYCRRAGHSHPAFAVARVLLDAGMRGRRALPLLESEIFRATSYLKRFLQSLSTISTIAPLLGLLGTVTGMIKSFHAFDENKVQNAQLVGGIDEALITTTLGLLVAIPSLIAYNYLANRVNRIAEETAIINERVAHALDHETQKAGNHE